MRSRFLPQIAVLILISVQLLVSAPAKRPNILFAFADDWGRYASAYAATETRPSPNQVVVTPNFDKIASEGVLFKNAFVTAPSCTPCRSSILSGQYFFRTGLGAILQGAKWDPAIPTYPDLLSDAGYHLGETYKVWSPGTPRDAPYGAGRHGFEKAGSKFNQFSQTATRLIESGLTVGQAKQQLFGEVGQNFDAFLQAREKNQPFCYWFGPTLVHRKWVKGSGKALWDIDPDRLEGKLPAFLPDVPEIRQDFADYLGEVQAFDAGLGVILRRLQQLRELNNTIIVISGDHGAPGFPGGKCNLYDFGVGVPLAIKWPGKPGRRIVEDFVNLMDLAPTFLEMGGIKPPAVMTGQSLVKVLSSRKQGWVDPNRNWVITGRERHVAMSRPGFVGYPQRSYRTKDHLYIVNFKPDRWPMGDPFNLTANKAPDWNTLENQTFVTFADLDASPTKAWLIAHRNDPKWKWHYNYAFAKRPREELYVLKDDPDQIRNVAGNPKFARVRSELNRKLMAELRRVKDPRVLGDGSTFDKPPYVGEFKAPKRRPAKKR
jgi:N-sulfoglucosamine sulfohydrolase